jgi:predicted RNA polymerase sigma factor
MQREQLEQVFRQEYGRIIATLIRLCGSFDAAEEAMQEAFAAALVDWQNHGVPRAPGAWITTTAQRKLIDALRRERTRRSQQDAVSYHLFHAARADLLRRQCEHAPALAAYRVAAELAVNAWERTFLERRLRLLEQLLQRQLH